MKPEVYSKWNMEPEVYYNIGGMWNRKSNRWNVEPEVYSNIGGI